MFASLVRWHGGKLDPRAILICSLRKAQRRAPGFQQGLVLDLEELLGRRVEIVTEKALNPYLRERVLGEAVPL